MKDLEVKCDVSFKTWMNEEEAKIYTTLSSDTLRQARDLQELPFRKIGKRIIYAKKDLDAYMESREYHINGRVKNQRKITV